VITVRAAPHVHSEWSYDATWTLSALADAFAKRRYDVVLTAEHDRGFDDGRWQEYRQACADASDSRILFVPGMEYEDPDSVVHVPVWGRDMPFLGESRPTGDVLREAKEAGGFAVFAHPWRRDAHARYREEWRPFLNAVEIWNRHYDGIAPNPGGMRFARESGLPPVVALDFHTRRQFFPLALLLEVEEPLSAPTVVDALHAGRFRPEAARIPAQRLAEGVPAAPLRLAEGARRRVRGPLRQLERRLGMERP
jgi:predicted metal-dependent phosphoesterase TrpH